MGYKLIGYKEPDLFEFFTIEEYERFTESPDLTEGLVPVYVATEGETPVDAANMTPDRVDETAKGEHEPIGYIDGMHGGYMVFTPINPAAVYLNGTALYLAPPKKEWVGLTDDEVIECFDSVAFGQVEDNLIINKHVNIFIAIRAIEAKLKEKNT